MWGLSDLVKGHHVGLACVYFSGHGPSCGYTSLSLLIVGLFLMIVTWPLRNMHVLRVC